MKITTRNGNFDSQVQAIANNPLMSGLAVTGNNYVFLQGKFKATNVPKYKSTNVKAAYAEYAVAAAKLSLPKQNTALPNIADNKIDGQVLVPIQEKLSDSERLQQYLQPLHELSKVLTQANSELRAGVLDAIDWCKESCNHMRYKSNMVNGIHKYSYSKYSSSGAGVEGLDTILNYVELDKRLAPEDAADYHNDIYVDLPILLSEPIGIQGWIKPNVASLLLSRTYSTDHTQTSQRITNIATNLTSHQYKYDVLAFITLGIARGQDFPSAAWITHVLQKDGTFITVERQDPLTIIHATNDDEMKSYNTYFVGNRDLAGFYKFKYNSFVFTNERNFMHEAAHAVVNLIFNNYANPYPKDKGPVYDEYQEATHELLLKIVNRLHFREANNLEKQSTDSLKTILTDETFLDLSFYANSPLHIENNKDGLLKKYFPGQEFANFTQSFMEYAATKIVELELTASERYLFDEITTLINYNDEEFDAETIVRLPHLAYEGVDANTMHRYFDKMEQFWNNHIHSNVVSLVEEHRNFCFVENSCPADPLFAGSNSAMEFDHCVEELLI